MSSRELAYGEDWDRLNDAAGEGAIPDGLKTRGQRMTLTEFLLARTDEDEAASRAAIEPDRPGTHWQWVDTDTDEPSVPSDEFVGLEYMASPTSLRTVEEFPTHAVGHLPSFAIAHVEEIRSGPALHIARWDPARVIAECEAKRRIVSYWGGAYETRGEGYDDARLMLSLLALPYADHPDYDEAWKP